MPPLATPFAAALPPLPPLLMQTGTYPVGCFPAACLVAGWVGLLSTVWCPATPTLTPCATQVGGVCMPVMCWLVCGCVDVWVCGLPRARPSKAGHHGRNSFRCPPRCTAVATASTPPTGMLLLTCCRHVCVCAAALLMCRFAAPLAFNFMAAIAMPERRGHTRPVSSEQLLLAWVTVGDGCWRQGYACRTCGQPTNPRPSAASFIPAVCRQLVACLLHPFCLPSVGGLPLSVGLCRGLAPPHTRTHTRDSFGTRYSHHCLRTHACAAGLARAAACSRNMKPFSHICRWSLSAPFSRLVLAGCHLHRVLRGVWAADDAAATGTQCCAGLCHGVLCAVLWQRCTALCCGAPCHTAPASWQPDH